MKAPSLKLSNNNMTVYKPKTFEFQTVIGNLKMSSGRHYWEIKIDKYEDEEALYVGIMKERISKDELKMNPLDSKNFCGYMALC